MERVHRRGLLAMAGGGATGLLGPAAFAAGEGGVSPVQRHGRLTVEGGRVVGASGAPATLRGMSLFWSDAQPRFYTAEVVRWLRRDWRVDAVRCAVAAPAIVDGTRSAETEEALVHTVVDAALEQGLYVIVDWHAHHPYPEAAIAFLSRIARRHRGRPNVLYELWNEPLPQYGWSSAIRPYHQRVAAAVRAEDPQAFLIAGVRSWCQEVEEAARDPLPLADVAYTLHFYAGTHRKPLRDAADRALARGAALFVSEYGVVNADGDGPVAPEETLRWWRWCEAHGISHLNWAVDDKREGSAALRPGASADGGWPEADLTASGRLVRAHLRAGGGDLSAGGIG